MDSSSGGSNKQPASNMCIMVTSQRGISVAAGISGLVQDRRALSKPLLGSKPGPGLGARGSGPATEPEPGQGCVVYDGRDHRPRSRGGELDLWPAEQCGDRVRALAPTPPPPRSLRAARASKPIIIQEGIPPNVLFFWFGRWSPQTYQDGSRSDKVAGGSVHIPGGILSVYNHAGYAVRPA